MTMSDDDSTSHMKEFTHHLRHHPFYCLTFSFHSIEFMRIPLPPMYHVVFCLFGFIFSYLFSLTLFLLPFSLAFFSHVQNKCFFLPSFFPAPTDITSVLNQTNKAGACLFVFCRDHLSKRRDDDDGKSVNRSCGREDGQDFVCYHHSEVVMWWKTVLKS